MGDDFDLFPKRENLDPFSFGKQEKKGEKDEEDENFDLFGLEEDASPEPPPPPPPDDPEEKVPTPEEETFDEPIREMEPEEEKPVRIRKKTSSPFVLIGGAIIIILGLLYFAWQTLIPDVPPTPAVDQAPAAVAVKPPAAPPVPAPEPEKAVSPEVVKPAPEPVQAPPSPPEAVPSEPGPGGPTAAKEPEEPAVAQEPKEAMEAREPEEPPAETSSPPPSAAQVEKGRYSVQLGALILEPSVRDLEKQVAGLGYETFRETGSTLRTMNIVTAGPFPEMGEGRKALSRIKASGIDSTLTQRSSGEVVVNAGSFLLEKNADMISGKIQDMGFPVIRDKKEVRLPVTFLRTGHFQKADEAGRVRDELKEKGLDALVVEVQ